MVRETVRTYSSRLPEPSGYNGTGQSPVSNGNMQARPPRNSGEQREKQVQDIIQLKKALAKTRQDLQKTRSRRQEQDNRSSSDEVSQSDCKFLTTLTEASVLIQVIMIVIVLGP